MKTKVILLAAAMVLTACGGAKSSPVTPAPEGLTFIFFYTDN